VVSQPGVQKKKRPELKSGRRREGAEIVKVERESTRAFEQLGLAKGVIEGQTNSLGDVMIFSKKNGKKGLNVLHCAPGGSSDKLWRNIRSWEGELREELMKND